MAYGCGVVAVVVLSLLPQEELPAVGLSDKVEHLIAYGLLTATAIIGFPRHWRVFALLTWCLGVGLEGLQSLVPGRSPSILDAVANTLGVALGLAAGLLVGRRLETLATPRR